MTKTKVTKNRSMAVMDYFIEEINLIHEMFVGSRESIRSIWINQDLSDRFLKTKNLRVNTSETVDGVRISREYVFRNDIIEKDYLEMIMFRKDIKEEVDTKIA